MLIFAASSGQSQTAWTWTPLANMPMEVANNAVAEGEISGEKYVYSFGGIDTTKIYSGQTKRAFRYHLSTNTWDEIDTLPIPLPLIASSANRVKDKIYIIGGYHVLSNGNETSANQVVRYDPQTNTYLTNGTPVPVPIDDQAQCVYKDSLIYVITGWSNSGNVGNIQIYNPELDSWSSGTALPNSSTYKAFGSSAQIIGDTIFYYGGASTSANFPAQKKLRKGIIDSNDPTQISWSLEQDAPNANYRSACVSHNNNVFWIGGSDVSYNYNGIAYNGSGGVAPSNSIARYDTYTQTWYEGLGSPYSVMDLRGYGQISSTSWVICGGMTTGQTVSDQAYLLEYDPITGEIEKHEKGVFQLINRKLIFDSPTANVQLIGLDGKILHKVLDNAIPENINGFFILQFEQGGKIFNEKIKL